MKGKSILIALLFSLLFCTHVFADGFHLDSKYGVIDYVRYEVNQQEQELVIVVDYTNTTGDTVTPTFQYNITGFQNGIELDPSYSFSSNPSDCKYGSTKLRPGATLRYCDKLELVDLYSPVELEVSALFDWGGDINTEMTIQLGEGQPAREAAPAVVVMEEPQGESGELLALQEELEKTRAELEKYKEKVQSYKKKVKKLEKENKKLKKQLED